MEGLNLFDPVTTYTVETDGPLVFFRIWVNGQKTSAKIEYDEKYAESWKKIPTAILLAAEKARRELDELPF